MLSIPRLLREIGRGRDGARDLDEAEAYTLFAAMLDGGLDALELGAVLIAFRMKSESKAELLGFFRACEDRLIRLRKPSGKLLPVIIPSYNGARHQANLTPLLALLLQRFGVPVLVHGPLEGMDRVGTASIFRELGILPCATLAKAQDALDKTGLAFVPTQVTAPGLNNLLALRARLGVRNSAHSLVKMIDPIEGDSVRLVSVSHPEYLIKMRDFFVTNRATALLLRGTEGEAFANPKRRPQMELFKNQMHQVLFEAESGPIAQLPRLPESIDADATAKWIRQALNGQVPLPTPLVNQLACCLYACGYAADLNQAKAIAAVETNHFVST
ncbi:anthranilate phosphoribosyltransferase [Chitinivorax tropicus]|uniref:Anthranilate phosphoribosyltransferase n=1 Tax=Chitinivorax tropicus TaxID=714531 RepID=A0A840MNJ7_9PROT|nr:DNA-binding protein YbiB [Chitinivorax tropicus]MBB5020218.1 anthranilate phosphoribosyltransferase [Chitinivorax tropicus]